MQPIVKAHCPACDNSTDFVVVGPEYCICSECGTTSKRDTVDLRKPNVAVQGKTNPMS